MQADNKTVGQYAALVVDDSAAMRRIIVTALRSIAGLVCTEARNGAQGVKQLANHAFDIILTDINMPVMDGLKLIAYARGPESTHRDIPLVVISSASHPDDQRRALALGADAYLAKPIQAPVVVATVNKLLNLSPDEDQSLTKHSIDRRQKAPA